MPKEVLRRVCGRALRLGAPLSRLVAPLLAGSAFGRAGLACGLPCRCFLVRVTWVLGGRRHVAVSGSSVFGEPSFPALA